MRNRFFRSLVFNFCFVHFSWSSVTFLFWLSFCWNESTFFRQFQQTIKNMFLLFAKIFNDIYLAKYTIMFLTYEKIHEIKMNLFGTCFLHPRLLLELFFDLLLSYYLNEFWRKRNNSISKIQFINLEFLMPHTNDFQLSRQDC